MAFPVNPNNGDLYTNALGTTWKYSSADTAWEIDSQVITGITGMVGSTGIQGLTGIYGLTGIAGLTGIYGQTGILGQTGIQGLTGILGQTGIMGNTGFYGLTGMYGQTGILGQTGIQGTTGILGLTGGTGIQGNTGLIGGTGVQGIAGAVSGQKFWFDTTKSDVTTPISQASAGDTFTFSAAAGTVVRSTGNFLTDNWVVGQKFMVTNSGTAMDNNAWAIRSVTSTTITITNGYGALTNSVNNATATLMCDCEKFTRVPATGSPATENLTGITNASTYVPFDSYCSISGVPGEAKIPAGQWLFHGTFSATNASVIGGYVVEVRHLTGANTVVSGGTVGITPALTGTPTAYDTNWVIPADIAILSTDRIVVRVVANNSAAAARNATWTYQGTTDPSWVETTFTVQGIQGDTGISGVTGMYGQTGIQGITGIYGLTGIQGVTGLLGLTGIYGQTGIQGTTGILGQTGIQGLTGIYGLTGLYIQGTTGIQGVTGIYGQTGIQGVTGILGLDGQTGIRGVTGLYIQGDTGIRGVTGLYIQGTTGIQGVTGLYIQGQTGIQGITGIYGLTGIAGSAGGSGATGIAGLYWRSIPGTPVRVSNTQFKVTDSGNAGHYDSLMSRGTVVKWTDSTGLKMGMSTTTAFAGSDATINIIGDIIPLNDVTAANFYYATEKARAVQFSIPGTLAVLADAAGHWYPAYQIKAFGVDAYVSTAGVTGNTTFDLKYDTTSMFTSSAAFPAIATATQGVTGITCKDNFTVWGSAKVQCDVTTVASGTAPIDGWVNLYFTPYNNSYL